MVGRTELELLIVGAAQRYLFNTYEPIILKSLLEEYVADYYLQGNRLQNLNIDNIQWMPRYITNVVNVIEADIYANIDDTIKDEPNIGADLLYMVSEEWDSTSSMLYSLIHTRARELLYPVYHYLSEHLNFGICMEFNDAVVINEYTIELTFRTVSSSYIEMKLKHLGGEYDVANRSYGGSPNRLVAAVACSGIHGLL